MSESTIFVATGSVVAQFEGLPVYIHQGVTTARGGHPVLAAFPHLFVPLRPTFEVEAEAEAGVEKEGAPPAPGAEPPAPSPADIRAWAAGQGIEVPAKGRIPADVNEAFQAAQGA